MYGWSLAARTVDELARLLYALENHRYLVDVDLRLHWSVDVALAGLDEHFGEAAMDWVQLRASRPDLDMASRDAALWRPAEAQDVIAALELLWGPGEHTAVARAALVEALREAHLEAPEHRPFEADPEAELHPELVQLDWELLPLAELDPERHGGALRAMAAESDAYDGALPVYLEGPLLSERELCEGAPHGVLAADPILWGEGPYAYCDYVLKGVARAAGLVDPPLGYRDIDKL